MDQRYKVVYRGHVQGVGFRFTTRHIAQRYVVTGFVRNLSDGTVELVAEGADSELKGLLGDIQSRMNEYIDGTAIDKTEATGEFEAFDVRF